MDDRLRELIQQLKYGETEVAPELLLGLYQNAQLGRPVIEFLAVLGSSVALELYNSLGLDHRPKLNAALWQEIGQNVSCQLLGGALNYPFLQLFNKIAMTVALEELSNPQIKNDVETLLTAIQNGQILNSGAISRISKFLKKMRIKYKFLPDADNYHQEEVITEYFKTNSLGRDDYKIIPGSKQERVLSSFYIMLLILSRFQKNCLAENTRNTFYRYATIILEMTRLFYLENASDFTMFLDNSEDMGAEARLGTARASNRLSKEQKAKRHSADQWLNSWLLPKAYQLLLTAPFQGSSAIIKDDSWYIDAIRFGRFTYVSVNPDTMMEAKLQKFLWEEEYPYFLVWTTNKLEAKKRAEKILYHIWGYIPDYSVYPRTYSRGSALIKYQKGFHEDVLPKSEVPNDVFREGDSGLGGRRQRQEVLERNLDRIKASRPDLY
jgi:hypothetical protein